jgi:hypothetical protein
MEQQPLLNSSEGIPKIERCYLCHTWTLASTLKPIAIPDQVGWVEKKACSTCLGAILSASEAIK